jgi:antitoxin component YwqK of YwqJK toxin-antitoxin module
MNSRSILILIAVFLASGHCLIAQKLITTYHDLKKTKKAEVYQVDASGTKNGPYKSFDQNGALNAQGNYKNGVKVGKWTYPNGPSTDIETFDNEGNKDGLWLKYCVFNPKVKSQEGTFKKNAKEGLWIEYECASETKVQKVLKKETYVNGEVVGKCYSVDKDGYAEEGELKGIQRVGEWKFYEPAGTIYKSVKYTDKGEQLSSASETEYLKNGSIAIKQEAEDLFFYSGIGPTIQRQGFIGEQTYYDSTGFMYAKNVWTTKTKGKHYEFYTDGKTEIECDVFFTNNAWTSTGEKTWKIYYGGHTIFYYPNGIKKKEYDKDNAGNIISSTIYEYNESGEPTENTKILMEKNKQ